MEIRRTLERKTRASRTWYLAFAAGKLDFLASLDFSFLLPVSPLSVEVEKC